MSGACAAIASAAASPSSASAAIVSSGHCAASNSRSSPRRIGSSSARIAAGALKVIPSCCALRHSPLGRPGGLVRKLHRDAVLVRRRRQAAPRRRTSRAGGRARRRRPRRPGRPRANAPPPARIVTRSIAPATSIRIVSGSIVSVPCRAAADRVRDERQQQHRRHAGVVRVGADVDAERRPAATAQALDVEVRGREFGLLGHRRRRLLEVRQRRAQVDDQVVEQAHRRARVRRVHALDVGRASRTGTAARCTPASPAAATPASAASRARARVRRRSRARRAARRGASSSSPAVMKPQTSRLSGSMLARARGRRPPVHRARAVARAPATARSP